jgi:rubrerythrin
MSPQTKRNLKTAMQNEAFSQAEYLRFAARARLNENWDLAHLFQTAADKDRTAHFGDEADLACLVADDSANLKNAIEEKRAAAEAYAKFAKEATADGDFVAAALFEKIRGDEAAQGETFEAALEFQTGECPAYFVGI